jgi:hypothetical protein
MISGLPVSTGFETLETANGSFLSHRCDTNVTHENEKKPMRLDYDGSRREPR